MKKTALIQLDFPSVREKFHRSVTRYVSFKVVKLVLYKETRSARNVLRAVTGFLFATNVPPVGSHQRMKVLYVDDCVDVSSVRLYAARGRDPDPNILAFWKHQ